MTADNFDAFLNTMLDRRPFAVFTVELHGGQRFEINNPRAMALYNGKAVFFATGGVLVFLDHESVNTIIDAPASTELRPTS